MQSICRITVPGLTIERDFEDARERLLGGFPDVREVIATTAPATLLVLYAGPQEVDSWLDVLLDSVEASRAKPKIRLPAWSGGGPGGDGFAA
jgi:hypothetical protein